MTFDGTDGENGEQTIMRADLQTRRTTLADELEAGAKMLAELDAKRTEVQQTMLRISGAIQILDELLAPAEPEAAGPSSLATHTVRSVPA